MKPEIIAASLVTIRHPNARVCAECTNLIHGRALRVAEKRDGVVDVFYYHDAIDEDDDIRGCAPEHPKVRAALPRKRLVRPT